tara:strand:+ start:41 stop:1186 length:1146 start_codon:yes stop_codon:yes gene_type:complete
MTKIDKSNPSPNFNDYGKNDITYEEILNCKSSSDEELAKDFKNCFKKINPNGFAGNKILYHYQFKELMETKRDKVLSLKEVFDSPDNKAYWIAQTIKMNRRPKLDYIEPVDIFECYRRCKGSVVSFKAMAMRSIIDKYNGTKVLDPTAGWGGRMLGSIAQGCEYTGIDTNLNLIKGYDEMIKKFGGGKATMIYDDCLKVDYSNIDYDIVITSPPYFNLEQYSHMTLFESNEKYHTEFLIPLIIKLLVDIEDLGKVCINISEYIYKDYLKYGGRPCNETFEYAQQMGGKKNKEFVYVFYDEPEPEFYDEPEVFDECSECHRPIDEEQEPTKCYQCLDEEKGLWEEIYCSSCGCPSGNGLCVDCEDNDQGIVAQNLINGNHSN